MALVVEDGTGKADAESYSSVAAYKSYCDGRGITYGTDASIEQNLRKGFDYMLYVFGPRWAGYKTTDAQYGDWPRYDVAVPGSSMLMATFATDFIPAPVIRANILLANKAQGGTVLLPDETQAIKRERVEGAVEIEYQDNSKAVTVFPDIEGLLGPLLSGGGGPNSAVYRG